MNMPADAEQLFREHAKVAVAAVRAELAAATVNMKVLEVFDKVLLPCMREEFVDIAKTEFQRIGKEHVRAIVLGVFDKFIEGKNG